MYALLEELEEIEILSLTCRLRARAFGFGYTLSGAGAGGLQHWGRVVCHMYAVSIPALQFVAWMRPDEYNKILDRAQFQSDKVNKVP